MASSIHTSIFSTSTCENQQAAHINCWLTLSERDFLKVARALYMKILSAGESTFNGWITDR
eukprot:8634-Heterococcus_DN1.PRE.1